MTVSEIGVYCQAQYLTSAVANMRPCDYDATHLVKAVKGLNLTTGAYTVIRIGGRWVTIREGNKDEAIEWFAEWAASLVDSLGAHDKVLVPVPASNYTGRGSKDFRTATIATAISEKCNTAVGVCLSLYWKHVQVKSRKGGTRDASVLYRNMGLSNYLPPGDVILIDDVYSTGGHLRAATWSLADSGREVLAGVCCGRTSWQQLADPFKVEKEMLDVSRQEP